MLGAPGIWDHPPPNKHRPLTTPPPHRRKSVLSPACIRATMVLVTEVPMLEPMMMGMAELTSSTGRRGNLLIVWETPSSCPQQHLPADPLPMSQPLSGIPAMLLPALNMLYMYVHVGTFHSPLLIAPLTTIAL